MAGYLIGSLILLAVIFSTIQLLVLWTCQGAVETAAHFAARKFAVHARSDFRKAKTVALAEASVICRHRPGGTLGSAALTSLEVARNGNDPPVSASAMPGEAYRIRLTHGVELIVPWIDRLLYEIASVPKMQIGGKYYLFLNATRWATVE